MEEKAKDRTDAKKLGVKETLIQTFRVYKIGFKHLIMLSALAYLCLAFFTVSKYLMSISLSAGLLSLIAGIVGIYFSIRANVGIYMLSADLVKGRTLNAKGAYKKANGLCGTYFAVVFLFSLIIILPAIGIGLIYTFVEGTAVKWSLILLLLIPLAFLITRYNLAIPSALFSEESSNFKTSKLLVKGDFWRVLLIVLLTYSLFQGIESAVSILFGILLSEPGLSVVTSVFDAVFWILTTPINSIAQVIMYLTLNSIKEIDPVDTNENESNRIN